LFNSHFSGECVGMELHPLIWTLSECLIAAGEPRGCPHPGSRQDPAPGASIALHKEERGVGPCQGTSASRPSNEPNHRVCHLLAGIQWKVLLTVAAMTTAWRKAWRHAALCFVRLRRRKTNKICPFAPVWEAPGSCASVSLHITASAALGLGPLGSPGTGWEVPRVLLHPTQPSPLHKDRAVPAPACFLLARGHFLTTPGSWPGNDAFTSRGETCYWNKLLVL